MNALLKLSGGIDAINRTIGRIFAWILLPMICLTAFEVFSRYVLKSPTVWAWELIIQIWGLMLMACGGRAAWCEWICFILNSLSKSAAVSISPPPFWS